MSGRDEETELNSRLAKWEEEALPNPEELTPLSQSLITPGLALALDIPTASISQSPSATKKPRLVWTPQLHRRFVDAIARLGIKNAVPKTITQLMNVERLTRENVASHLQKYRLYLKRMQSSPSPSAASALAVDAATDRLFATAPVPLPHQFLGAFVPVPPMQQHRPIAAASAQQNQYCQQRQMGMVMREPLQMLLPKQPMQNPYVQYLGSRGEDGRKALKLFPTGLD